MDFFMNKNCRKLYKRALQQLDSLPLKMRRCTFCSKRFFTEDGRYQHEAENHVNPSNPQVQYMIRTRQIDISPPAAPKKHKKYRSRRADSQLIPLLAAEQIGGRLENFLKMLKKKGHKKHKRSKKRSKKKRNGS